MKALFNAAPGDPGQNKSLLIACGQVEGAFARPSPDRGNLVAVKRALHGGAWVSTKGQGNMTPLDRARLCKFDVIVTFLERFVDMDAQAGSGRAANG